MTSRASLGLFHVLLAILWLPIVATAQQPGRELVQIPVVNKTTSIKVVGLYKVLPNNPNSAYSMVMENASGKDIVAYSIGYREHSSIGYEGVGETIPSGKRFERQVQRTENITVRYVIFEDGSIDGDPAAAAEWIDRQHAEAEQQLLVGAHVDLGEHCQRVGEGAAGVHALASEGFGAEPP